MSLRVFRAREQVGQWMVVSVVTAFVVSMGLIVYAKYIDDRYGALPGEARTANVQSAEPHAAPVETETRSGDAAAGDTTTPAVGQPAK